MFIFKNIITNELYIFIHIPKNGGRFIRNKTRNDKNNEIIKHYWHFDNNFDLAHIPYMKKEKYIDPNIEYFYFTYTRNPYDRIISAFFYKNPTKNIQNFKDFCKNQLLTLDFNLHFDKNYIHYYPQYLFICDEKNNIPTNIEIKKIEEHEKPKRYNLIDYFDNECIEIINKVYKNDFLLLNYETINKI
jgi:hypothetical protein